MRKWLLLGVLAASAAPAEKPLVGLIQREDYPPEAVARGEEGTVKVRLGVSKEGRAMSCTIVQSATQALDAATCYVMMRRARFKPATDEAGNPAAADFVQTIQWKLGDFRENPNNNSTRM